MRYLLTHQGKTLKEFNSIGDILQEVCKESVTLSELSIVESFIDDNRNLTYDLELCVREGDIYNIFSYEVKEVR